MTLRAVDAPARLDAGTLERPLDTLVWADGGTLSGVQPFSLRMFQMHEALQAPGATTDDHLALLRLCVPDGCFWTAPSGQKGLVDETYRLDLTGPRVYMVFEHAQYRLRQMVDAVEDARKNGDAGVAAADAPPPPSAPTTNTSTRSRGSRARSQAVVPGSTSRTRRSTSSSTPSIG